MRRKYAEYTTLLPPSLCVIHYPHGGGGKIALFFLYVRISRATFYRYVALARQVPEEIAHEE
jgi:hypothetical protein